VAVKDLAGGGEILIQGDKVYPAASVIKVQILVELYRQAAAGIISLDDRCILRAKDKVTGAGVLQWMDDGLALTLRDLAHLMIVISDNTASNMLIDVAGIERINAFMRDFGMRDTVLGRKFNIDPNATTYKNFTTARDMMVLFERLWRGDLLGAADTEEVLMVLKRQKFNEKIPLHLPSGTMVAHKTGEVSRTRHDTGIVFCGERPFVLCVLAADLSHERAGDGCIARISRYCWEYFS
jgi:beta-lactamase class A